MSTVLSVINIHIRCYVYFPEQFKKVNLLNIDILQIVLKVLLFFEFLFSAYEKL